MSASVLLDFVSTCNTVFESRSSLYHLCGSRKVRPFLIVENIKRGSRKRGPDELRRTFLHKKGFTLIETLEYEWWRLYKTATNVRQHVPQEFPYRRSLTVYQFIWETKNGKLFGCVQCDIKKFENFKKKFANFPPTFENILLSKTDKRNLMKTYAEEEGKMPQLRKMLTPSFTLQNGTLITLLLLFCL